MLGALEKRIRARKVPGGTGTNKRAPLFLIYRIPIGNQKKRNMKQIAVISSSVREGRLSDRVALYLKKFLEEMPGVKAGILDLKEYDFPLFEERFVYQRQPSEKLLDFTEHLTRADGVVLVSPVYNASFPASLKNVIDLYYNEWKRKPVAVVSVTSGQVPGIATVQELQVLMLKLGAFVVPKLSTVIRVGEEYTPEGDAADRQTADAVLLPMAEELMWMIDRCIAGR